MSVQQAYECFSCRKVAWFLESQSDRSKCPACGGSSIQLLTADQVREGRDAGTYFKVDLKTGGRAKPRKR